MVKETSDYYLNPEVGGSIYVRHVVNDYQTPRRQIAEDSSHATAVRTNCKQEGWYVCAVV
jgi:hypothetical protein